DVMSIYERRIGNAFLMQSAVRRDAERVTAEEIRADAQELETALGGTYTHIATNGQGPYSRLLLKRSGFNLLAKDVVPTIVTGLDALGKSSDLDKIAQFSQMMQIPSGWAPEAQGWIKWDAYMTLCAANLNMETPFLMTKDEHDQAVKQQQEMQQQQAMMEAAGKAAPQMMKGAE
ncbi:MAG: portal protein, partial [Shewanella oncorhynchi]